MSVYQGFATRQQESHYFHLVERIVKLIAKKCLSSIYEHPINDDQWAKDVKKAFTYIYQEDEHKYVYPRFSDILKPFVYFVSQRYGLLRCPSNETSKTRRNKKFAKFFESAATSSIAAPNIGEEQKSYIENTMTLKAYFNQPATDASWNSNSVINGRQSPISNGRLIIDDKSSVKFQDQSIIEVEDEQKISKPTKKQTNKRRSISKQLNKSAFISRDQMVNNSNNTLLKKASLNPYEQNSSSPIFLSRKLIKEVKPQQLDKGLTASQDQGQVKRVLQDDLNPQQRPKTQALHDAMHQIMNASNRSLIANADIHNQHRVFHKRNVGQRLNNTNRENTQGESRFVRNTTPIIKIRSTSSSLSAERYKPSKQSIQKKAIVEEGSQLIYQVPQPKFVRDFRTYSNKTPL